MKLSLPHQIRDLVRARDELRDHYARKMEDLGATARLSFTFDGNLVGDIGEALAVEYFGIKLVDSKSFPGIDGYAPDDRTVQVKATGTGRGPAFRKVETMAEHLLFFDLNLEEFVATVVFNGPEHYATDRLPDVFKGQRSLTRLQIETANQQVPDLDRLIPLSVSDENS